MGSEYQSLIVNSNKIRWDYHHPKGKHSHQKYNPRISNKDISSIRCFTCDEKGHISRFFPRNKGGSHKNKGNKRRHHAHAAEDDEPSKKRVEKESEDSSTNEEYVFISSLTGTVTHGNNHWLIVSGSFKNMIGFKESFVKLSEHESPHKVKLGDDY